MSFSSKKTFFADPSLIPAAADEVCRHFVHEGYDIKRDELITGGVDISIAKGSVFKAILGMKTALKITIRPDISCIIAEAGVGIFGQQAVPTIISTLFFWPVIITQTWGLIQQSKLDDHAMELLENALRSLEADNTQPAIKTGGSFCPECGAAATGNFCSSCGKKLN